MKVLNRFMSALGYVPASAKYVTSAGSIKIDVDVDSSSLDAAIAKLGQLEAGAIAAEAAINSAAALADFGSSDLCAEPGRDLVLEEVRAQREQIAKVLTMLEAQQHATAMHNKFTDRVLRTSDSASGLPG